MDSWHSFEILDLCSSSSTIGYVFVSGQFLDGDCKLQRRLLNVVAQPYPDSNTALSRSVTACLSDWGMFGKLFSLTISQQLSEASIENLRALLAVDKPSVLDGQLLVRNCLTRSMSGIVTDAYASVKGTISKVSDIVKHVKLSKPREQKFLELKQCLRVPSSAFLAIEDRTKWNTTYQMLLAALELKEVFSCLDTVDEDFKHELSEDDWSQIKTLCTLLKPFYDTATLLTAPGIQTTDAFFHKAWKIKLELSRGAASEDRFVRNLTNSMREGFDRYWDSSFLVLSVAVAMDPRFKMKLVGFCFSKLYGDESSKYLKAADDAIHGLFREYNEAVEPTNRSEKSELDRYVEEPLLPRGHGFDVMGWWKLNRARYPLLTKMALDVLSVPVCTVPAGSVFDTVHKEMDSYWCSLRPETLEALVCTKDWLMMQSENSAGSTSS